MKKVGIIIISILLILSVSASGIGYYYGTNNKMENNNTTDKTENQIDNELEEYFNKVSKKYDNIYTIENTELQDFNFDKETEKLFMDNFIIENLEDFDFGVSYELEKVPNQDLIKNWLFVYIVKDQNINEACFSKELLINTYEKIFGIKDITLEKIFNESEITSNYVCYSKKTSDIKEYKYKEVKKINSNDEDNSIIPYYEIKDNKDKIHYISIDIYTYDNNFIDFIYSYNAYEEKAKIEDIIEDKEFDKEGYIHLGLRSSSDIEGVEYLKESVSYELESGGLNIKLDDGKLIFKQNNKEATVPVKNIKEVVLDGETMTKLDYEVYFFNDLGELYYYDEIPYEGQVYKEDKYINVTLKKTVKNYKKVLTLDKKIKNFVFKVNDSDEYDYVLEILLKLEDDTLYSIKNNKEVDYLISLPNDVTLYKNKDVKINNKIINYKFKSLYDVESFTDLGYIDYFITEDDYLYDVDKNKLVTNSKVDKIYKQKESNNCYYNYLIDLENKETIGIAYKKC